MKISVTTLDGEKMTSDRATEAIGTDIRITPSFAATGTDDEAGIETGIEAHYNKGAGRYIVTTIVKKAIREDFDADALRSTAVTSLLQHAVPRCIAVSLFDDDQWTTVADISAVEGRLIPRYIADAVVKRGQTEARMETVRLIFGAAALAGLPPVKAVQQELGVPHRTASDWIMKARRGGWLEGFTYIVGRQADI